MPKQVIEDLAEVLSLFERAEIGYLAMSRDGDPYLVPLSFVCQGGNIYFHCAISGQKLDYIVANPRVCFAVHTLDALQQGTKVCDTGIRYHSALAFGRARVVDEPDLKMQALRWLCDRYAGGVSDRRISDADAAKVTVVEIAIERMTGKRNVARQM